MRTLVTFEDEQIRALDTLARRQRVSRAELIRRAVDRFLDLVGDGLAAGAHWVVIPSDRLAPEFFRLRSGYLAVNARTNALPACSISS